MACEVNLTVNVYNIDGEKRYHFSHIVAQCNTFDKALAYINSEIPRLPNNVQLTIIPDNSDEIAVSFTGWCSVVAPNQPIHTIEIHDYVEPYSNTTIINPVVSEFRSGDTFIFGDDNNPTRKYIATDICFTDKGNRVLSGISISEYNRLCKFIGGYDPLTQRVCYPLGCGRVGPSNWITFCATTNGILVK